MSAIQSGGRPKGRPYNDQYGLWAPYPQLPAVVT